MDDFKMLNNEEFKALSDDEKRDYVRKLIHAKEAANIKAAFFNTETNEELSLSELVERLGEEETIDIVVEALSSTMVDISGLNSEKIKELLIKKKKGELTEQEEAILDFVMNKIEAESGFEFSNECMEVILNLIHHGQRDIDYNPDLSNFSFALDTLFICSEIINKNGIFANYSLEDSHLLADMSCKIADDIYNTWRKSCTTMPEPGLVIAALFKLISRISIKNDISFAKAKDLSKILNLELYDDSENGSNENDESNICQPLVYHATVSEKGDIDFN